MACTFSALPVLSAHFMENSAPVLGNRGFANIHQSEQKFTIIHVVIVLRRVVGKKALLLLLNTQISIKT